MAQTIFKRHECKYLLEHEQYSALQHYISGRMKPDEYGSYTVSNIYYDTDKFDLVRASIEKPVYKEKLRLRSYGQYMAGDTVFLELKKKYKGVVYKRRATLSLEEAMLFLKDGIELGNKIQILNEMKYFLALYQVSEKAFICYDRIAMADTADDELRITFDSNIRFRQTELSLEKGNWGTNVLQKGQVLMEVKTPMAIPVWLSHALSNLQIFPSTFSKYGFCYKHYLMGESYAKEGDISA